MSSPIITRFAPSPTGDLHVGSARTALFNYLFAKKHGGQCLLRIEDTDHARSTEEATKGILNGLNWLGIPFDGEPIFQAARATRHQEVAIDLLANGKAYKCFATTEELAEMRAEGHGYDRRWRDNDNHPGDQPYTIRIKLPTTGETVINDAVQGPVTVPNDQLDDFVLLRADGTPTYMLSVVVDDHDMGITHVIRGDDHLNNAFRQYHLYQACGWDVPTFAHIPLIHGADGAKLSKRHGAVGVEAWREQGFLPEALVNYLLLLGWHPQGEQEIIGLDEAAAQFDLGNITKGAARFDEDKLTFLNAHYLREADTARLQALVKPLLEQQYPAATEQQHDWLAAGFADLQERAETVLDLAALADIYLTRPTPQEDAAGHLTDEARQWLATVVTSLESVDSWDHSTLFNHCKGIAKELGTKIGKLAMPMRVALTGRTGAPSNFSIMEILGKEESLARLWVYAV